MKLEHITPEQGNAVKQALAEFDGKAKTAQKRQAAVDALVKRQEADQSELRKLEEESGADDDVAIARIGQLRTKIALREREIHQGSEAAQSAADIDGTVLRDAIVAALRTEIDKQIKTAEKVFRPFFREDTFLYRLTHGHDRVVWLTGLLSDVTQYRPDELADLGREILTGELKRFDESRVPITEGERMMGYR